MVDYSEPKPSSSSGSDGSGDRSSHFQCQKKLYYLGKKYIDTLMILMVHTTRL